LKAAQVCILGLLAASAMAQIEDAKTLQEACDMAVNDYTMVGVATSIFTAQNTVAVGHAGERKVGEGTPIEQSDQWIMGSNTKSMVATIAAKVIEQGLIRWDSTAKEIFEDGGLFEVNEGYYDSTLELFLSHGSGAPGLVPIQTDFIDVLDYIFNVTSWEPDYDNREARIFMSKRILQAEPYQPLYQFEYSIGGFTVAGAMLEIATGKTFEQLTKELLFDPLGMEGCGFGPTTTDASLPPVAPWGHLSDVLAYKRLPVEPSNWSNIASPMVPDGGIKCTLASWQKYLVAHLTNDETFLPKEQWEYIHTPLVGGYYGYGWFIDTSQAAIGKILTHGGTDGHNFANNVLVPRFGFGLNIGLNDPNTQGSRSGMAYSELIAWMGAHPFRETFEHLPLHLGNHIMEVVKKAEQISSLHL